MKKSAAAELMNMKKVFFFHFLFSSFFFLTFFSVVRSSLVFFCFAAEMFSPLFFFYFRVGSMAEIDQIKRRRYRVLPSLFFFLQNLPFCFPRASHCFFSLFVFFLNLRRFPFIRSIGFAYFLIFFIQLAFA